MASRYLLTAEFMNAEKAVEIGFALEVMFRENEREKEEKKGWYFHNRREREKE